MKSRSLTCRQREVLTLAAQGHWIKATAEKTGLSYNTVTTYRKDLLARMSAATIAQAVAIGVRDGLITA